MGEVTSFSSTTDRDVSLGSIFTHQTSGMYQQPAVLFGPRPLPGSETYKNGLVGGCFCSTKFLLNILMCGTITNHPTLLISTVKVSLHKDPDAGIMI